MIVLKLLKWEIFSPKNISKLTQRISSTKEILLGMKSLRMEDLIMFTNWFKKLNRVDIGEKKVKHEKEYKDLQNLLNKIYRKEISILRWYKGMMMRYKTSSVK